MIRFLPESHISRRAQLRVDAFAQGERDKLTGMLAYGVLGAIGGGIAGQFFGQWPMVLLGIAGAFFGLGVAVAVEFRRLRDEDLGRARDACEAAEDREAEIALRIAEARTSGAFDRWEKDETR